MTVVAGRARRSAAHASQAAIGLALAGAIVAAWTGLHILDLFVLPWRSALALAPLTVPFQCWLAVGLFIVAHDAMHGSLAPRRPAANRAVGRLALMLYAGIWYDSLVARHFAHHRSPGTEHDPDFAGDGRVAFPRWFRAFFTEYLSRGQVIRILTGATLYVFAFGVPFERLLLFWALPALLSALQLFTFGTYLPHRRGDEAFGDAHRTRSNDYSWAVSLLTCFHFGYHHEHHADPSVPWWRLPSRRASEAAVAKGPRPDRRGPAAPTF